MLFKLIHNILDLVEWQRYNWWLTEKNETGLFEQFTQICDRPLTTFCLNKTAKRSA